MSVGLQLILSTALAAAPPGCSWANPGANPFRGEPARALADFGLPQETQRRLRALMATHQPTDVVTITRDDIAGAQGYADMRDMHSGGGQVCRGQVDRSAWSPQHRERALVYCADEACVIVPTICNNISLVSRKPDDVAARDDSPIDIEPAAGPPPASSPAEAPSDFLAPPIDAMAPPDVTALLPGPPPERPAGGDIDGHGIGGSSPGGDLIGGATPIGTSPSCCDLGPIEGAAPVMPPAAPPAVPEAPSWMLLGTGLALVLLPCASQRRRTAQAKSRSGCACAGQGETK